MRGIYSYVLRNKVEQVVTLPADAEIFTAKAYRGQIRIWAIHYPPDDVMRDRKFLILMDNDLTVPAHVRYLGSIESTAVPIRHIFEVI